MKRSRFFVQLALSSLVLLGLTTSVVTAATDSKTDDAKKSTSAKPSDSASLSTEDNSNSSGLQSYTADKALQIGTIVQLVDAKTANKVEPASKKKLQQMYGAVIDPHKLSFTISDTTVNNQTYVATSGTYDVLVSTEGGTIAAGDYVTMSALDGVAMKADYTHKTVFGRAASGFDGKNKSLGTASLKSADGKRTQTVAIGVVPVAINVQNNPIEKTTKANLPQKLQRVGLAIADKPISPLRIYLSVAITAASLVITITILYAGVRNSIVSIGRNPLSRKSIIRGLVQIVIVGFLVVVIGLFAVYLLLKL